MDSNIALKELDEIIAALDIEPETKSQMLILTNSIHRSTVEAYEHLHDMRELVVHAKDRSET